LVEIRASKHGCDLRNAELLPLACRALLGGSSLAHKAQQQAFWSKRTAACNDAKFELGAAASEQASTAAIAGKLNYSILLAVHFLAVVPLHTRRSSKHFGRNGPRPATMLNSS